MRLPFALLAAIALTACPSTSDEPDEPTPDPEAHVDRLTDYLIGTFDSEQQSIDDPRYFAIQLITCAVDAPELGERVLYVEQARMDSVQAPYRQRIYVVEPDEGELAAKTTVYALVDEVGAIGLCGRGGTAEFEADEVEEREGCGVFVTYDDGDDTFTGGTDGDACSSTLQGATYATSDVTITADRLDSWDRGYDATDTQVWGATAGAYQFLRRD